MSNLGIFIDRQTISNSRQLTALLKCRDAAEAMGHNTYFIFPVEIKKIYKMDALFIRSRTDPMNISYVASKIAHWHGIPVIDDPYSIQICSDKINMYLHLMRGKVSIPKTEFISKSELTSEHIDRLFNELGAPIVLKEPSTSFSVRVEQAYDPKEFLKVAMRFIKMSDCLTAQEYIESSYDWRIGVLNGEFCYACKYIIPSETFKIQASINGHIVYCAVESIPKENVPKEIIDLAIKAANSIGKGLYGIDIKESNGTRYVIEVNDNPSLESGEDDYYPDVYNRIITHLLER